uniref:CSON007890 protein n=1 Tax=Culicoides sonorensis TaxID=179676 RepID=A0A336LE24_CULSO
MRLTIKVLQGSEFEIQIPETASILDIKKEIAKVTPSYPIEYQKLLSSGRTLLDEKNLEFYKIKDLSKLMLVIKKPEPINEILMRNLKKYYSEEVADKIVKEFLKDYDEKMKQMSLDDMERLVTSILVK